MKVLVIWKDISGDKLSTFFQGSHRQTTDQLNPHIMSSWPSIIIITPSQVYSGTTDPYLSFLSDNHSLFSAKPTSNGKKSDPLKFSDPLSFGTSDPLSYGASDPLRFELLFIFVSKILTGATEDLCLSRKSLKNFGRFSEPVKC